MQLYPDHAPERAFNLWRYFVAISLAAATATLALTTVGIAWLFNFSAIHNAEKEAVNLADYMRDLALADMQAADGTIHEVTADAFPAFDQRMRRELARLEIVKIKIFAPDTRIIYSTDTSIVGQTNPENEELQDALVGHVESELEAEDAVWDLAGEQRFNVPIVESYVPLYDAGGRIVGALEVYSDVSRLRAAIPGVALRAGSIVLIVLVLTFSGQAVLMRRAHRTIRSQTDKIRHAHDNLAAVIANANTMVIGFDRDLRISLLNPQAEAVMEVSRGELVGQTLDVASFHDGDRPKLLAALKDAMTGQSTQAFLARIRTPDKRNRSISWNITEWRDGRGGIIGAMAFGQDITGIDRIALYEQILPICSYCKQIRAPDDSWVQVESYVAEHSEARFSHSICPNCLPLVEQQL